MVIPYCLFPFAAADSPGAHMNLSFEDMEEEHLLYDNASVYDAAATIGDAPSSLANEFPKTSYADWNQGTCGNCWVWAGTGALAQSLFKFNGAAIPVSIQFFNSNFMEGNIIMTKPHDWACTGGFAYTFADIYTTGVNQSYSGGPFVVPWSNFNASYKDAEVPDNGYVQTTLPKNLMINTPNTGLSRVVAQRVLAEPYSNQTAAVENITLALVDGKVLFYVMTLPNRTAWSQFNPDFWRNQPDNNIWDMDLYNQSFYNESSNEGSGHAMIIMGYNKTDTDPARHYWIVQNSWGTETNHPKGQYRLKMWMDYNATFNNTEWTTQEFWVFNVSWKTDPTVTAITPSTGQNTSTVTITNLAGSNFADGTEVRLKTAALNPRHFGGIVNGTDGALIANPYRVTIANNYAYIASYNSSALEIVNLTNPSSPVHEGRIVNGDGGALLNGPIDVAVSGNYAYVASYSSNALEIVDVSTPSAPVHKGKISHVDGGPLLRAPRSVNVVGNYAYVASYSSNALEIVDISNPAAPAHVASITDGTGGALLNGPVSVDVVENYPYVYVASSNSNALEIVNISNPAAPEHMASISDGTGGALLGAPKSVTVVGYYAYIASYTSNALEIIDISNKSVPVHKGSVARTAGDTYLNGPVDATISADATYAYITSLGGSTLDIVDVTDPSAPVYKTGLSNGTGGALLKWPSSVALSRSLAYVTSRGNDALEVVALDAIPATGVTVVSPNTITGTFDLTGAQAGTWDVVVVNSNGRSGTLSGSFTITAFPTPVANFTANQTRIETAPAAVKFSDTSLNNPTSWSWDFGDGNTSTLQNPVNTYRQGKYNVSLTATNAYGSNTKTETYYIYVGKFPIVSFNYAPTTIQINDTVSFDASASFDPPPGGIINYEWNFGDGNITSNSTAFPDSITHIYNQSQVYNITLTITDTDWFTNSTMHQLSVIAKIGNSNSNINGTQVHTNADNKQMIEVNITNTNGTVTLPSANTMVIDNPGNGWSRMKYVSSVNFINESSGNINLSSISQVVITTTPLTAVLNQSTVGTVTSTVTLPLKQLPTGVTMSQSITEGANTTVINAFQLAAQTADSKLNVTAVAYTVQFSNTAAINANRTGASDPIQLNLSVLHSWVLANGGTTKIRIFRFADDGTQEMLTTTYLGSTPNGLTDFFRGDSPNGLSTFGVTAVSSTGGGGSSGFSDGGSESFASIAGVSRTEIVNVGGGSAVTRAEITGTGLGKNLVITAMPRSDLPTTIAAPSTIVYQYMSITSSTITGVVSQITLDFSVPQSWLTEHRFTNGDIVMMHNTEGQWQTLDTRFVSQKSGNVFYRATAPGFSYFAIAYQKGGTNMTSVTPVPTILASAAASVTGISPSLATVAPKETQTVPPARVTTPVEWIPQTIIVIGVIGAIVIIIGVFLVRRWWIRRQNPALFREYD